MSIHCRNVHDLDINLYNVSRSISNVLIESPYVTSYLMTIVTFDTSNICHLQDNRCRNVYDPDLDIDFDL